MWSCELKSFSTKKNHFMLLIFSWVLSPFFLFPFINFVFLINFFSSAIFVYYSLWSFFCLTSLIRNSSAKALTASSSSERHFLPASAPTIVRSQCKHRCEATVLDVQRKMREKLLFFFCYRLPSRNNLTLSRGFQANGVIVFVERENILYWWRTRGKKGVKLGIFS